jgi:hypothetical protein
MPIANSKPDSSTVPNELVRLDQDRIKDVGLEHLQ